jgi:hypothetical protein
MRPRDREVEECGRRLFFATDNVNKVMDFFRSAFAMEVGGMFSPKSVNPPGIRITRSAEQKG